MKKININLLWIISVILTAMGMSGCVSENTTDLTGNKRGYSIEATIEGYDNFNTRAGRDTEGDLWTIKSFTKGDIVGFYSKYGNNDAPGGNGSFENVPLTYGNTQSGSVSSFFNNEINFNTDNFVENTAFFYYPYGETMDYDPEHIKFLDDGYGFELRDIGEDGVERCNDLLWIYGPSQVIRNISFNHAFSSIVILRGEGFENAENKTVKVVLDKGFSHAVIEDENRNYLKYFRLVYLDGYKTKDGVSKTEEQCRVWEAWQGNGDYIVKDNPKYSPYPSNYDGMKFKEELVHYVVLPTHRILSKPKVEYIEIYDNTGRLHKISNFVLYNQTRELEHSQRYPLVIKLQDLEAVVTPVEIKPWGEDKEISEERAPGIENPTDFIDWLAAYGTYLDNNRSDAYETYLTKFGDRIVNTSTEKVSWKFYLNFDIDFGSSDFSQYVGSGKTYILEKLEDTLEGGNHIISGLNMSASSPPAFIKEIRNGGTIQNTNFKAFNLSCTNPSSTSPAGGIASLCAGSIENCKVDGTISTYGPVGMIAGELAASAKVTRCVASGLLFGSSTTNGGLVGVKSEGSVVEQNNTAGIIFQSVN